MSSLKVSLPANVVPTTGLQVSFVAPCGCDNATSIVINNVNYCIVDAMGCSVVGRKDVWCSGAVVSVLLDTVNNRAFLLNATSVAPENLLDNSNFRNPVNQRGGDLYSGVAQYTIDRWRAPSALDVVINKNRNVELICASSTVRNGLSQNLPVEKRPAAGVPITLACEDSEGNIYVGSAAMPDSGYIDVFGTPGDFSTFGMRLYGGSEARVSIMVPAEDDIRLVWVAMYEGAYTNDTLPAYRPKSYADELAECMRYYQVRSTHNVPFVDLRPPMISKPTVTEVDSGYGYSADL